MGPAPRTAALRVVQGGVFHAMGVARLATGTGGRPAIALTCGARAARLDGLLGLPVAGKDSHGFIGYDPNTGYANAVRAERLLGNAVLLTHEGYGHLSLQNPRACVDQAMVAYLTELITPPRGTVCQSDQQPFDPGFA